MPQNNSKKLGDEEGRRRFLEETLRQALEIVGDLSSDSDDERDYFDGYTVVMLDSSNSERMISQALMNAQEAEQMPSEGAQQHGNSSQEGRKS